MVACRGSNPSFMETDTLETADRYNDGSFEDKKIARQIYKKLCEKDDGQACIKLGYSYYFGVRSRENLFKGLLAFKKACDDTSLHAVERQTPCEMIPTMVKEIEKPINNPDPKKVQKLNQMCDKNNFTSCLKLGDIYNRMRDFEKSYQLYKKSCDGENQEACENLGDALSRGNGVFKDEDESFKVYDKSCKKGYTPNCYKSARMYVRGIGVEENEQKGVKLYKNTCKKGYARSCEALADYYEDEAKLSKSYAFKALKYHKRDCKNKDPYGCYFVAIAYHYKNFGPKDMIVDRKKAFKYYKKACKYGEVRSCMSVKSMRANTKKYAKMEMSCNNGNVRDCKNIADAYASGQNIKKDKIKARKYNKIACKGGMKSSCLSLALGKKGKRRIDSVKKLCNEDYAMACRNLAFTYMNQSYDRKRIYNAFAKACKLGDSLSCNQIGK